MVRDVVTFSCFEISVRLFWPCQRLLPIRTCCFSKRVGRTVTQPAIDARQSSGRMTLPSFLVMGLAALAWGCGRQPDPLDGGSAGDSESASSIVLIEVGRDEYDEILTQFRGSVVLVDFWATWCGPCVDEFPHTVELHRRFADRGLSVLTVSCDEPDEPTAIRQFLASQEAYDLNNFVSVHGGSTATFDAFEIANSIPHFKVYDRRGRLQYTFGADTRELSTLR